MVAVGLTTLERMVTEMAGAPLQLAAAPLQMAAQQTVGVAIDDGTKDGGGGGGGGGGVEDAESSEDEDEDEDEDDGDDDGDDGGDDGNDDDDNDNDNDDDDDDDDDDAPLVLVDVSVFVSEFAPLSPDDEQQRAIDTALVLLGLDADARSVPNFLASRRVAAAVQQARPQARARLKLSLRRPRSVPDLSPTCTPAPASHCFPRIVSARYSPPPSFSSPPAPPWRLSPPPALRQTPTPNIVCA